MRQRLQSSLAVLILIGSIVSLPANAATVDELLRKHLDALGGETAVRSIKSVSSTAEIEILGTGLKGSVRSQSIQPCFSYSYLSLGFFTMREGYDGEHIWMVDTNGKLQYRRDEASLEYQKTMCLLESWGYLFGGVGFELKDAGKDTIEGAPCEALDLEVEDGSPCRIFLSDSTLLVRRIEINAPEGKAVQTFDDYRRVDGVAFPFRVRTEMPALGQRIEIRYESIIPNAIIDPIVFLPPATDVRDYRFVKGNAAEGIPFTYKYRHLFIPATIGDLAEKQLFLIDSGASMTVVDSSVAARLNLPLGGKIPGAGAGGLTNFYMTLLPGLNIQGIEFSKQIAIANPIAGLLKLFEETEIGGILGYDFLSRFTTRIDYEHRLLSFFEPDSFVSGGEEVVVEAPLIRNIFSVPVTIDGQYGGTFLIDTGANTSIIQGAFAERNGLAAKRGALDISIRGAGGSERASLGRFDSLTIGGWTLRSPVLAVVSGAQGLSALEGIDGVIGNDILERFTVTLDYERQRVLLERNSLFAEPFYRDRSGLQLVRKDTGEISVAAVLAGSPAEAAGLATGDLILAINRKRAAKFSSIEELMKLFEAKEGTRYKITASRNGKKLTVGLVLRQYL